MSQTPGKKRKLPRDVVQRNDSDAVEMILGKQVKRELDKAVQTTDKKGIPAFMTK